MTGSTMCGDNPVSAVISGLGGDLVDWGQVLDRAGDDARPFWLPQLDVPGDLEAGTA